VLGGACSVETRFGTTLIFVSHIHYNEASKRLQTRRGALSTIPTEVVARKMAPRRGLGGARLRGHLTGRAYLRASPTGVRKNWFLIA
jgi:hypothetical protein